VTRSAICPDTDLVRVSAKADYGFRAMIELARRPDELVNAEIIALAQDIPAAFLRGAILPDLRRAGLVFNTRGPGRRVPAGPPPQRDQPG